MRQFTKSDPSLAKQNHHSSSNHHYDFDFHDNKKRYKLESNIVKLRSIINWVDGRRTLIQTIWVILRSFLGYLGCVGVSEDWTR